MSVALPGTRCRRRVYLMRHAAVAYFDKEGRPLDPRSVPLTEEGAIQARSAGTMLAEVAFDVAVCSGLPRTIETARVVLGARELALEAEPRLKEAKAGRLRELPVDGIEQAVAYAYDDAQLPGARFIGGESWQEFAGRVSAAWTELMRRPDWVHLLIVAHDAVNRVILSRIAGSGLAGIKAFEQDPACINIIDVDIEHDATQRELLRAVNLSPYNLAKTDIHATVMEGVFQKYRRSE